MFDLLIKGGTLPDGSVSDIAITGDRIAATGRVDGAAREVIEFVLKARGLWPKVIQRYTRKSDE